MTTGRRIFVFGSNLSGIHGKGAAREAREHHGAEWGVGQGLTGHSYAIPTKERDVVTPRSLSAIQVSVDRFLATARRAPEMEFYVTAIGCGFAGYRVDQIAPMFRDAPPNCHLNDRFTEWLKDNP